MRKDKKDKKRKKKDKKKDKKKKKRKRKRDSSSDDSSDSDSSDDNSSRKKKKKNPTPPANMKGKHDYADCPQLTMIVYSLLQGKNWNCGSGDFGKVLYSDAQQAMKEPNALRCRIIVSDASGI